MEPAVATELKWLYEHAIGAQLEYEDVLGKVANQRLTHLFEDMIELHEKNARELALALQKDGELTERVGQMSNAERSAVADPILTGSDYAVLECLIDGELSNIACYNKALNRVVVPSYLKESLIDQQLRIDAAILDMQMMLL